MKRKLARRVPICIRLLLFHKHKSTVPSKKKIRKQIIGMGHADSCPIAHLDAEKAASVSPLEAVPPLHQVPHPVEGGVAQVLPDAGQDQQHFRVCLSGGCSGGLRECPGMPPLRLYL